MTIKFPDLSHHNTPISVAGAVALIVKATEGATFKDPAYSTFKAQAGGIPFMGYHWVNTDAISTQAANAISVMRSTPCMWDAEAAGVTVPRLVQLTQAYRALGGVVHMVYLPHWYWQGHMGSPSLQPLVDLNLHLVSSNYTAYSDSGPGWAPYGGMTPVQWQYTDAAMFNGKPVDFNAYKGTVEDYRALISGGTVALTQADINAVVKAVFAEIINSPALGYSQPFSEYVKFIKANSNDIAALNTKLDRVLALLVADGGVGLTPAQIQEMVDTTISASKIVPPAV
jgi:hypothetical protein